MYESFFGLREKPFNLTPDPRYFYLSESHREALAALIYGIRERVGLITLTGPVGVGKTMILASFLDQIREYSDAALFSGSISGDRPEFLADLCSVLGIESRQDSLFGLSRAIKDFAVEKAGEARRVVVLVDEAQELFADELEHFHHLSNLEIPETKLLQIVLAGTEKLDVKLRDESLEALWQRVAIRCAIKPIEPEETIAYIFHRLRVAGSSSPHLFSEEALWRVLNYARGVPRLINLICNQAMLSAYSSGQSPVGEDSVLEALEELDGERPDNGKGEVVAREEIKGLVDKVAHRLGEDTVSAEEKEDPGEETGGLRNGKRGYGAEGVVMSRTTRQWGLSMIRPRTMLALFLFGLLGFAVVGVLVSTGLLKPAAEGIEGIGFDLSAQTEPRSEEVAPRDEPTVRLPLSGADAGEGSLPSDGTLEQRAAHFTGKGSTPGELVDPKGRGREVRQRDIAAIALEHYGRLDSEILRLLRKANPQIRDWNNLNRNAQIVLPDAPEPQEEAGVDFHSIQVGAFRVKEGALWRASELAEKGVQNLFLVRGGQDKKFTFVCAGVFETGRQSSEGVWRIREMGFEDAFPTRIREKRLEQVLQPYAGPDAGEPHVQEGRTTAEGFPGGWE